MTAQRVPALVTATLAPITHIRDTAPQDYLFSAMKVSPAQVIAELLRICFPDARTALDMTYGKGNFWDGTAHVDGIGMDRDPARARDVVGDYRAAPFADDAVDVAIFDPQFLSDGGKKSIMRAQYTDHGSVDVAHEDIARGCLEAWRVARLGIIVKVQDHHHQQRFTRMTRWVEDAVPMPIYDELMAPNEQEKVIDPKWRQPQLSTYRCHSTYLVFRKDGPVHKRRAPSPELSRLMAGPRCHICDSQIGDRRADAATCSDRCRQQLRRHRRPAP
jgi:hypothetical protein